MNDTVGSHTICRRSQSINTLHTLRLFTFCLTEQFINERTLKAHMTESTRSASTPRTAIGRNFKATFSRVTEVDPVLFGL